MTIIYTDTGRVLPPGRRSFPDGRRDGAVAPWTTASRVVLGGRRAPRLTDLARANPLRVTHVRDEGTPHMFVPYHFQPIEMALVVKTSESAASIGPTIKRAVESPGTRPPEGVLLSAIGAAIGLLGAMMTSVVLRDLPHGVAPDDSATLVTVLVAMVAVVAALRPAWTAAKPIRVRPCGQSERSPRSPVSSLEERRTGDRWPRRLYYPDALPSSKGVVATVSGPFSVQTA